MNTNERKVRWEEKGEKVKTEKWSERSGLNSRWSDGSGQRGSTCSPDTAASGGPRLRAWSTAATTVATAALLSSWETCSSWRIHSTSTHEHVFTPHPTHRRSWAKAPSHFMSYQLVMLFGHCWLIIQYSFTHIKSHIHVHIICQVHRDCGFTSLHAGSHSRRVFNSTPPSSPLWWRWPAAPSASPYEAGWRYSHWSCCSYWCSWLQPHSLPASRAAGPPQRQISAGGRHHDDNYSDTSVTPGAGAVHEPWLHELVGTRASVQRTVDSPHDREVGSTSKVEGGGCQYLALTKCFGQTSSSDSESYFGRLVFGGSGFINSVCGGCNLDVNSW